MKKLLFAALFSASFVPAVALAGPAPASKQATAQATPAAEPAAQAAPTAEPAPAAQAAPPATLDQMVAADFPKFDADKSGELSSSEFDTWMTAAKKQSGAAVPDGEWLSKAFTKADSDQNKTVSANELTAFLSA
jgi:hypothetical protein